MTRTEVPQIRTPDKEGLASSRVNRLERLREQMPETMSGVLVTNPHNITYLTGFRGLVPEEREVMALITKDGVDLYLKPFYEETAQETTHNVTIHPTRKPVNPSPDFSEFATLLEEHSLPKVVGVEENNLTIKEAKTLEQAGLSYAPIDIDGLREVKDPWEIKQLRRACEIADGGFAHILPQIKTGMTELEIKSILEQFMLQQKDCDGLSFPAIVAYGKNAAIAHHESDETLVEEGNFLIMDFGATVNGYHSDMTRTIFIGTPTEEQRKLYETVLQGQQLALAYIANEQVPLAREVDALANRYFQSLGYPPFDAHSHAIGLADHEPHPNLLPMSNDIIIAGNVITAEPGIYLPNITGVRIEDEVVKTENGIDVLTTSPKKLITVAA